MFATKHESSIDNKCCQVFVRNKGYVTVYPMTSQDAFETSLHWCCKEVSVPVDLIVDGFSAQKIHLSRDSVIKLALRSRS